MVLIIFFLYVVSGLIFGVAASFFQCGKKLIATHTDIIIDTGLQKYFTGTLDDINRKQFGVNILFFLFQVGLWLKAGELAESFLMVFYLMLFISFLCGFMLGPKLWCFRIKWAE